MALACFRYNSGVCTATEISPYQAMFWTEPFQAWGELDLDRISGEPHSLARRLPVLHKQLMSRGKLSRAKSKKQYDRNVNPVLFNVGERVLLWSEKHYSAQGKEIVKPWVGPYAITARLGEVGYKLEAEAGDAVVHAHANRLRRIGASAVETGDPASGMFPDSLRIIQHIKGTMMRSHKQTKERQRHFKVMINGRREARWTAESDLPEAVVKLYDARIAAGKDGSTGRREQGTNSPGTAKEGDGDSQSSGSEDSGPDDGGVLFKEAAQRWNEQVNGEEVAVVAEDWIPGKVQWADRDALRESRVE